LPGSASGSRSHRCRIAAKAAAAHTQRKSPECPAGQDLANGQRQKGLGPRPSNSVVSGADDATVPARRKRGARSSPILSLGFNGKTLSASIASDGRGSTPNAGSFKL
jgi:hypothetical protein